MAAAGGTSPAAPAAATLEPVTYEVWRDVLAKHRGDIVVVDFWATWCLPCMERFPHMVELHDRYAGRGVTFLSMSLDDHQDADAIAHARTFLTEHQATFDNYLMDESIPDAFAKLDLLGIPAVFVYDREGKLAYRLTEDDPNHQFTDADVDAAIEALLDRRLGVG